MLSQITSKIATEGEQQHAQGRIQDVENEGAVVNLNNGMQTVCKTFYHASFFTNGLAHVATCHDRHYITATENLNFSV